METISDYQPILIWLAKKEEEITIGGYNQIFRNDRSGNSGGNMLAVKKNHKNSYTRGWSGKRNWAKLVDIAR